MIILGSGWHHSGIMLGTACALDKVFWEVVCGFVLGQLGSNMLKRSCLRGNSGSLFEHVGSNESLEVLVPQISPLGLVDGKLFLSSRRLSRFLWGCSLKVGFRKYRFKHRCTCFRSGCGVLLFFVAGTLSKVPWRVRFTCFRCE